MNSTVLAHAGTTGNRLADALGADTLPVTHERLSQMLGVRRSGVTVAIGALERAGLITHGRGAVTVAEPAGLTRARCGRAAGLTDEYDSYINDLGVG